MSYSDRDLLVATQIAYYNISKKDEGKNLREIFDSNPHILKKLQKDLVNAKSDLERSRAQSKLDLYEEIKSEKSKYGNWIIRDVNNDNNNSGFVGCLIETDDNSAIVGFRGSESMSGSQFRKDWLETNFSMLNGEDVQQQTVATKYMEKINSRYHYDNYALSGHSLGGNLAAHAGITAPKNMQDKITQCISFDGPGFSDEYIRKHRDEIARFGNKVTHYQWSLVGNLLHHIPGENFKTIKTKSSVSGKNDIAHLTQKHDVSFVEFDNNNQVIEGEMDPLARTVGHMSRKLEDADMGSGLVRLAILVSYLPKKTIVPLAIIGATGFISYKPAYLVAIELMAISLLIANSVDPDFFSTKLIPFLSGVLDVTTDVVEFVRGVLYKVVENVQNISHNLVSQIYAEIQSVAKDLKEWLYKNSVGYKAAQSHPYFEVNTSVMRERAAELRMLCRRANQLDQQMNSLYLTAGIDWNTVRTVTNLGKVLSANLLIKNAQYLERCATYLETTAESFERSEKDIIGVC